MIEDKKENLEAAKQAASNFPQIEFEFLASASQAMRRLQEPDVDGIATGLFFPPEEKEELNTLYRSYLKRTFNSSGFKSSIFREVMEKHYRNRWWEAIEKITEAFWTATEGSDQVVIERWIVEMGASHDPRIHEEIIPILRYMLENLPAPEFPYGAPLMLRAETMEKKCVLITELHYCNNRIGGPQSRLADAVDGMILLLPLMEEGVLTVPQAMEDGKGSLTYIGRGELVNSKEEPESWKKAIEKILSQ